MIISETQYKRLPERLQKLFTKQPNPSRDEVVGLFPQTKGEIGRVGRKSGGNYSASSFKVGVVTETGIRDSGSASRFFYCAKASKSERNKGCENLEGWYNHPTVKPVQLMEYLVKLVSREDAVVLDPFTWSWSTLIACKKLKRQYIWFELDEDYITIAEARLQSIKSESFTFFKDYPWNKR
jgi:tRNA G10  N-methylase Trm11